MVGAVKDFKYRELAGQEVYDNVIADVEDKANNMFDKEGFQVEFEKESAEKWSELDEKSKKVVNQKQKVSEELAKQTSLYESALKEIDELRFDGKTASEALAEIQAGTYKTQAEVDAAIAKAKNITDVYNSVAKKVKSYRDSVRVYQDLNIKLQGELDQLDLNLKDFGWYKNSIDDNTAVGYQSMVALTDGVIELGQGLIGIGGMLGDVVMEGAALSTGLWNNWELGEDYQAVKDWYGTTAWGDRRMQYAIDDWQAGRQEHTQQISLDNVDSLEGFGEWAMVALAGQAPQLALMMATSGLGSLATRGAVAARTMSAARAANIAEYLSLGTMGATSMGTKWESMRLENELYGADYSLGQMLLVSVGTGAVEAFSEKITYDLLKGAASPLSKGSVVDAMGKMRNGFGRYFKNEVLTTKNLKHMLKSGGNILQEGGSEVAATMGQNIFDMAIAQKDGVHMFDGVKESFVTGALIGGMMTVPSAFKRARAPFMSVETTRELSVQNYLEQETQKKLDEVLSRPESTENTQIAEELQQELLDIVALKGKLIALDVKRVDVFTEAETKELIDIDKRSEQLKKEYFEAKESSDLTVEAREAVMQKAEAEFQEITKNKQKIIDKYPPNVVDAAYRKNMDRAQRQADLSKRAGGVESRVNEYSSVGFGHAIEKNLKKDYSRALSDLQLVVDSNVATVEQKEAAEENIRRINEFINTQPKMAASLGFGVHIPIVDDAGKLVRFEIAVNTENAIEAGNYTTGSHEMQHSILYNTIKQDPGVRAAIGNNITEMIDNGEVVFKTPKAERDYWARIDTYRKQGRDIGEEQMVILSEMLSKGDANFTDTGLDKMGRLYRGTQIQLGMREVTFDNKQDLKDFITGYHKSVNSIGGGIRLGKKGLEQMYREGAKGKIIDKGRQTTADAIRTKQEAKEAKDDANFSLAVDDAASANPDLLGEFDNTLLRPDGSKIDNLSEYQRSPGYADAWTKIAYDSTLDALISIKARQLGVPEGVLSNPRARAEFIQRVKERLSEKFGTEFDPAKNESLFGWMTGKNPAIKFAILDVKKAAVQNPLNAGVSLDAPAGEGGTTFGDMLVDTGAEGATGGTVETEVDPDELNKVWEDLGLSDETIDVIRKTSGKSNIDISNVAGFIGTKSEVVGVEKVPVLKNGKPVLDKKGNPKTKTPSKVGDVKFSGRLSPILQAVSNEFGVDHRKVPTGITLKPIERNAIINRIAADPTAILNNMPDQHTRNGKAVGTQQVLLDALFEDAGYRGATADATAAGDVGMDAQGLAIFNKKANLDEVMLMKALGVEGFMKDGKFVETGRYDTKETKHDSILKAVVSQVSTLAANQQLRLDAKNNNSHPTDIIAEFGDGKNQLSYSLASGAAYQGNTGMLMEFVDFLRQNPNYKQNPAEGLTAWADSVGIPMRAVNSLMPNVASFVQAEIEAVYEGKAYEDPMLMQKFAASERTMEVIYADSWGDYFEKIGLPKDFNFDRGNANDRAQYETQTREWLKTVPDDALDNQMYVNKLLTNNESNNPFFANSDAVKKVVAQEKARRASKNITIKSPLNWKGVVFNKDLMNKLDAAVDGRFEDLGELSKRDRKAVEAIHNKHKNIKDPVARHRTVAAEVTKLLTDTATSDPAMVNKAFDLLMTSFNDRVNEAPERIKLELKQRYPEKYPDNKQPTKKDIQLERENRLKFVSTTFQDQTNRSPGIIKGAANFTTISLTPGKTRFKGVAKSAKLELAESLGITGTRNQKADAAGLIVGASSFSSTAKAHLEAMQNKVDKAIKESLEKQGIKQTKKNIEAEKARLNEEYNTTKTRHGEHDLALMLMSTTVFNSMRNGTFNTDFPLIRKHYSQTAFNEDMRYEVDEAWGKTGNAPGWNMGMPAYLRFVAYDPSVAEDILEIESGATLDRVIASDIALNNIASEYGPIVDGARQVLPDQAINSMDAIMDNVDTREQFNELVSEIANAHYNGTDLVAAEAAAIKLVGTLNNINEINTIREAISEKSNLIESDMSYAEMKRVANNASFSMSSEDVKGASVLDFDDTLAITKSKVLFTKPDGTTGSLNAEQYARDYLELAAEGYEFDFSEFNKVVEGQPGPLLEKAKDLAKRYGTDNIFVLTARAPQSQEAIFEFLKAQGLNLPPANIVGLGNSTGAAKAQWILENIVNQGYNDIAFADDALQNVEAVQELLDKHDVNSKVRQAKMQFSLDGAADLSGMIDESVVDIESDLDSDFNTMLEETKGVGKDKRFSPAKARKRGKNKGRFKFFIPPSADDFAGLMYYFMGKGRVGENHHAWFKKNLFDPFSKGVRQLDGVKQVVANEIRDLRKTTGINNSLKEVVPGTEFTLEDAIRIRNWDKAGFDIPGLSQADKAKLIEAVESNPNALAFADGVANALESSGGIVEPGNAWEAGTVNSDANDSFESARSVFLQEWINNKNIVFSAENLNKIEAVYGTRFREALEDSLWRMEHGGTVNRGKDRLLSNWMTWLHGSVGATMFFNARSALLQQLSNVNFMNWHDNNPLKAAAAFANQPQYWSDVAMIFNSPFLKQRRGGLQTDINAKELLDSMKDSKNPMKSAIAYLLKIGFTPTQIGDSIAIATGGATMYRNRVNTYLDQGMTQAEAESKAFEDMMEIAEETQQSTREDKISQQQASPLGKLVLAFQNVTMQYNRIMKKAAMDLVNGRGDPKAHISKIIYYGAVQNMIFYGLQQALFAALFSDDEEDDIDENKKAKLANGMLDSILRGSGLAGAVVSTAKNVILKFMKESDKMTDDKFYTDPDWSNVMIEALNISPPIGIKARKIHSALKTWEYNDDIIEHMDKTDIDNPMWEAIFNTTEALTNAPTHRLYNKYMNIRAAMDADNETWQRVAMALGWSRWSFGVQNQDVIDAKGEVRELKQEEAEERREQKKIEKEAERQAAAAEVIEEHKVDQQEKRDQGVDEKDITCAAVNKSGKRCGKKVLPGQSFCTIHEEVPQQANETQCSHVKANGDRCKMKTKNQSGKCYYHD